MIANPDVTKKSKPLIAHVIYRLDTGGMENGLVNLLNTLPVTRFRHAVICLTCKTRFAERIRNPEVQIFELNKREGKDPAMYLRFWRLLRRLKPAVVHTRNLGTIDLAPIAALARVPVRIHSEHGWDASDLTGTNSRYRLLRKICNLFIFRYIAVSKDITRWLTTSVGLKASQIVQIYNGVDIERFAPTGKRAVLNESETTQGQTLIGTVGRMDRIKGFDILLDAFARHLHAVPDTGSGPVLLIVGTGPELENLKAQAARLNLTGQVRFAGSRDDIPDVLRRLDIFVLPSLNEGISNTILEAMATGLAVIATDVGGNGELIENGDSGTLIASGDASVLEQALANYLKNPLLRQQHGDAARRRIEANFSLPVMVQQYARVYDELVTAAD